MVNGDTLLPIGFIIVLVGFGISIWNFFQAYKKSLKESENGTREIDEKLEKSLDKIDASIMDLNTSVLKMNFKTDSLCNQIQTVSVTIEKMKSDLDVVKEKQIKQDVKIEALQKQIDLLNGD